MNYVLIVCAVGVVLALAELVRSRYVSVLEQAERDRSYQNFRVRAIHEKAGNVWYPHLMSSGQVRWYRVDGAYPVDM